MVIQARKMVAVYEQAIADRRAGRHVQVDMARLKTKLKDRYE